jgi:hypothetical protein
MSPLAIRGAIARLLRCDTFGTGMHFNRIRAPRSAVACHKHLTYGPCTRYRWDWKDMIQVNTYAHGRTVMVGVRVGRHRWNGS